MVADGVIHPIAFGSGASIFNPEEQERQKFLITKQQIIPILSLLDTGSGAVDETPIMRVNFGQSPFHFQINATALCQIHQHISTKGT